jgi:hypothetical protein
MISAKANESSPGEDFWGTLEGWVLGALLFAPGNERFVAVLPPPGIARRRRLWLVTKAWQR